MSDSKSLRDHLKMRRQAIEDTMVSDVVTFDSEATNIEDISKDEVAEDDGDETMMLQALQTRRLETQHQLTADVSDISHYQRTSPVPSISSAELLSSADDSSKAISTERLPSRDRSLSESIKERLRNRVKGLREQSSDQPIDRKFKALKDRPLPTRFDSGSNLDLPYDSEMEAVLQASMASTKEWKRMKSKQRTEKGIPSEQESYNFFIGVQDFTDEEMEVTTTTAEQPSGEVAVDIFDAVYIDQWMKPEYIPYMERMEIESALYSLPNTMPALLKDKVPSGAEPRFLVEEGLYVGNPPPVRLSNLYQMENRILMENKEPYLWFTEEGRLKRLPNPLRDHSIKAINLSAVELDPLLQTEWMKTDYQPGDPQMIEQGKAKDIYQLDVDVSSLYFSHHPLFSKEHVLASRLQQLYNQYTSWQRASGFDNMANKISALRTSLKEAEKRMDSMRPAERLQFEHIILQYKREIRVLRRQKNEEEFKGRCLLKAIFRAWKQLKYIRSEQGYTSTPAVIKVRKIATDKANDEAEFQEEIIEEFHDMQHDFDSENIEKIQQYNINMLKYKKYITSIKEKKKKQRVDGGQSSQEIITDDGHVSKPEPPPSFNDDNALKIIESNMLRCKRRPGEPLLIPEVQNVATITPVDQCPRIEQLRRGELKSFRYYVRVLFNDKEVSRTGTRTINPEFSLYFGEILNVRILQWPESIKLQIFDDSNLTTNLLAEVYLPIPGVSMVTGTAQLEAIEFSSDHYASASHSAVGSGVPVDLNTQEGVDREQPVTLLTSGFLYASTTWGLGPNGKPMAPPASLANESEATSNRHRDALTALGATGLIDIEKLVTWLREENLDPNDPSNSEILGLIKLAQNAEQHGPGPATYFRLDQLETEMNIVNQKEFDECKRFRLLSLRDEGVPEFKNMKLIPSTDKGIPESIFDVYEARLKGIEPEQLQGLPRRTQVSRFIAKVREQVLARTLTAKKQLDLQDVVIEDEVPDLGTLGLRIIGLFAPRRPLRPIRKERKRMAAQTVVTFKDVNILVNIVRAFNIPVRTEPSHTVTPQNVQSPMRVPGGNLFAVDQPQSVTRQSPHGQASGRGMLDSLVRPFIEILFQDKIVRTSVADGPAPSWNEDIVIPFRAPNDDYTSENLQSITDKLFINLFDEINIDLLVDDRERGTRVHQRIEKHWLGSIEMPFSTVYFNSKVEGCLRVNSPPVLLGYQSSKSAGYSGLGGGPQGLMTIKDETYLQVFVTIEPQLPPAQPIAEMFDSAEDSRLLHNAQIWLSGLRNKFPKREFKTMVSNIHGKKIFLTRYITKQCPPVSLLGEQTTPTKHTMSVLARFVSRIPYISDSVQFPDLCDIWSYSEQFLNMLAGDEEEHAVLLCNYFLWIGVRAWLVLGKGVPEGETAYVLSLDTEGRHRLWNASSGESYEPQDPRCPLQSIGCVVDESNIWANVQADCHPSKIDFTLTNPKLWNPFFSRGFEKPDLASVQCQTLEYSEPCQQAALDLQDQIERILRDKIMDWRPRFVTRWNRYCTQAFRDLLVNIESQAVNEVNVVDEHKFKLEQITSTFKLTGYPLDIPFAEIDDIVNSVYGTSIHNCEDAKVEFALAVSVHPYPQSVFAVWVYVARLSPKLIY